MMIESIYASMPEAQRANEWLDLQGEIAVVTPKSLVTNAIVDKGFFVSGQVNPSEDPFYEDVREEIGTRHLRTTLLERVPKNQLIPGTNILNTECGGTRLRLAAYHVVDANTVEPIRNGNDQPIRIELPFQRFIYKSVDDFFNTTADMVSPVIDQVRNLNIRFHALSNIFSHDSEAQLGPNGIFLRPDERKISKGFIIPGIGNILYGEQSAKILVARGITFDEHYAIVDLNDTPAVLEDQIDMSSKAQGSGDKIKTFFDIGGSTYEAVVNLSEVGGTGFNHAVLLKDETGRLFIWNMETGDLQSFLLSGPEAEVNRDSVESGHHLSEAIMGGGKIGDVLGRIYARLHHKGILKYSLSSNLTALDFSNILHGNKEALRSVLKGYIPEKDTETWTILRDICIREWQRAVYTEARIISAIISIHPEIFTQPDIIIPCEGSKFWLTPGYAQAVAALVETYLPGHRIIFVEASGARGAARVAAWQYAKSVKSL